MSEIEQHEYTDCKLKTCELCQRILKEGTVSMQTHLALHCEQNVIPCQFCFTKLPRAVLKTSHSCNSIIPRNKF